MGWAGGARPSKGMRFAPFFSSRMIIIIVKFLARLMKMIQHNGGLPGVSSTVAFFPNDGLGIAILMNSADKAVVNEAIQLRIAEDVLGLERTPRAEK